MGPLGEEELSRLGTPISKGREKGRIPKKI